MISLPRPARDEPILLLAGGTGFAPMKSILQHIEGTDSGHEVVLYHGVPTAADLYEHAWLTEFLERINAIGDRISRDFLLPLAA